MTYIPESVPSFPDPETFKGNYYGPSFENPNGLKDTAKHTYSNHFVQLGPSQSQVDKILHEVKVKLDELIAYRKGEGKDTSEVELLKKLL